ncbi:MAG: peptidyl-prolyl cis-trans isomerase [Treponema sp.]|jgi:parvulin-like peptidyl-prolyl isomerase|nr:peptidyl-prolyl cis-trans isomerase [Treponema sp.]
MKRFISVFGMITLLTFAFPGMVFSGGSGQSAGGSAGGSTSGSAQGTPLPSQGSQAQNAGQPSETAPQERTIQDPVVASVQLIRTESIFLNQLKAEVEQYEKQTGQSLSLDNRREILNSMINQRLVLQAAERDRILISDGELNNQVQQLRDQLKQSLGRAATDAEFAQAVRNETGLDVAAFRDQLRRQLVMQKYLIEKKRSVIESVKAPSDAEINEYFANNRDKLVRNEMVRAGIIYVPGGAAEAEKTRGRELANRLSREIGSSAAKFDDMVEKSQAPNSGYQARVGFLERNQQNRQIYGSVLIDTVFALDQGKVSPVLETTQGFFIFKVTNNYPFKALGLDDEVQPDSGVILRNYIRSGMLQERQAAVLAQAEQELVIELRGGNPAPFQIFEQYLNW